MTQDPERYAYKNLRWNLIVRTADLGLWHGGQSLASIVTVIPAFAARLGASNTVIGLIPAIQMTCMSLPGIFFANYIEQSGRLLPFLMRYTALERLPLLVVAIAAYFLAQSNPKLTLALTLMALTVMYVAGGAMLPAWMGLMAKIFPVNVRGRFFALVGFLGAAMGLGASGAIGYVLNTFPYPLGYVVCLASASIVMGAGVIILAYVREAHVVPERPRVDLGDYLSRLPSILRVNRNFTWYLAARSVASFGAMSTGFFTVYALGELDMAEWQVGAFTFAMLAAQVVVFPVVGYLADRFGHKLVVAAGTVFLVLANVGAVLAAEQGWVIYLVFVCGRRDQLCHVSVWFQHPVRVRSGRPAANLPRSWRACPSAAGLCRADRRRVHRRLGRLSLDVLGGGDLVAGRINSAGRDSPGTASDTRYGGALSHVPRRSFALAACGASPGWWAWNRLV